MTRYKANEPMIMTKFGPIMERFWKQLTIKDEIDNPPRFLVEHLYPKPEFSIKLVVGPDGILMHDYEEFIQSIYQTRGNPIMQWRAYRGNADKEGYMFQVNVNCVLQREPSHGEQLAKKIASDPQEFLQQIKDIIPYGIMAFKSLQDSIQETAKMSLTGHPQPPSLPTPPKTEQKSVAPTQNTSASADNSGVSPALIEQIVKNQLALQEQNKVLFQNMQAMSEFIKNLQSK